MVKALPVRRSTRRRSLIAGICSLLLSQPVLANEAMPAWYIYGMLTFYLLVGGGVGAICGNVCAARGLSPWRGLRYVWIGIFLPIFGISLAYQYDDFLIPHALIGTAVFAVPITVSALFFHAWRRWRMSATAPIHPAPPLSRRRMVVEGVLLLLVPISFAVAMFWHRHV